MRKLIAALSLLALVGTGRAETIDPTLFTHRAPVTFPTYNLESTLENFPVLVRLTSGTYTILSATDGITGEFAEIITPKSSWRVSKVNVRQVEQEEGEPIEVYDALTVSIPGRGMRVFVR